MGRPPSCVATAIAVSCHSLAQLSRSHPVRNRVASWTFSALGRARLCWPSSAAQYKQVVLQQHLLNWSQSVELLGRSQYAPAFEPVQPRFEERACGRHPGQVPTATACSDGWVPPSPPRPRRAGPPAAAKGAHYTEGGGEWWVAAPKKNRWRLPRIWEV